MFRAASALLLATTILGSPAIAADVSSEASVEQGETIVVTGQREEYGVKSTSTATKTNTDIKDIPQALTIISESQIEDQQLRSIADVLYFVPARRPAPAKATATRSRCAATTPPPIFSSTACATTSNISATSITSTGSRC